jgi:hypothetical protein
MSRLFGRSGGGRLASRVRLVAGATGLAMLAVLGVAGAIPAAAAAGVTASAQGTGLQLVLFGTKLTGGNSSACVNDTGSSVPVANANGDGSASACDQQAGTYAASEGEGTLLTSAGVHEDQKASESTVGQSDGSTNSTCAQGGGTPGGTPVTLSLGLSCAYAQAAIDPNGNPAASSMGEVSNVTIGLNGILSPILGAQPSSGNSDSCNNQSTVGALLNTVCTALSNLSGSAPQPVSTVLSGINQALQNLFNVVTKNLDPTITIDVGQAKSSIETTANTVKAVSQGSTLDVAILPGVGCAARAGDSSEPSLAQCVTDALSPSPQYSAPLIEVLISPAQSASTFDGSNWSSTGTGAIATVDINIPGAQQVISLGPNVDQTLLAGTPLQTTIDLGSAQTNHSGTGAASQAHGAVVNLLESSTFPGGSSSQGAVSANLGSAAATAAQAGSPPPPVTPTNNAPPVAAVATSTSPTAVHTGEWWSGSMPLLVALAAIGGGLIAWPRLRRIPRLSKLASKGRHSSH